MELLEYLWVCWWAYRNTPRGRFAMTSVSRHGVPRIAVMIARDRAAWRLSTFAVEFGARLMDEKGAQTLPGNE